MTKINAIRILAQVSKSLAIVLLLLPLAACNFFFTHDSDTAPQSPMPTPNAYTSGKQDFLQGHYAQSFNELLPAAHQGNAEAQYAVGYMMYYGLGTHQNKREAYAWTKKAAAQGLPEAKQALSHYNTQDFTTAPTQASAPTATSRRSATVTSSFTKPATPPSSSSTVIQSSLPPTIASQEQQFMALPDSHYTVQVMGSHDYSRLQRYAKQYQLPRTMIFRTYFQGKYWYVLTSGQYTQRADAQAAANQIKQNSKNVSPWVRQVKSIKNEIHHANSSATAN